MGKYTWSGCPDGYREAAYDALKRAETLRGSPVYLVDIFRAWNSSTLEVKTPLLKAALMDLYKADEMIADTETHRFSINPAL